LVLLDLFAQSMPDSIDAQLEELQPAFEELLKVGPGGSPGQGPAAP
jgi:hypothetical protein